MIDSRFKRNTKIKQSSFEVTDADWTKIVDYKDTKVDREYFGFQVKGSDAAVKVLLTTDITLTDDEAFEVPQGFLATGEWLYLTENWYAKVVTGGTPTKIAVWESVEDGNPKR